MELKPSITTAFIFIAVGLILIEFAYPFLNIVAVNMIRLSNTTVTNGTPVLVQTGNTTITLNQPSYYTQQYNVWLTLWSFLASPFFSIVVFAMLVGVGMVYWYLREK